MPNKPIFTCMITQEQTSTNITNQILFLYLCSTMIGHVCFSSIYTIEKKPHYNSMFFNANLMFINECRSVLFNRN